MVIFVPQPLLLKERYLAVQVWINWRRKNLTPVTGFERPFLGCPTPSLVSILTEPSLLLAVHGSLWKVNTQNLMFIGPCIIVIVEERKTNLMSLAILFHFLCAQHVSDINISIIRSLRLRCHHLKPAAPKAPTHNELRTRRPMW